MITWNVSPELIQLGNFSIRWYGLFFAIAIYTGMALFERLNRSRMLVMDESRLLKYVLIGTVAGARIGHCAFYDPLYYLKNPLEVLMVWKGGLASHGAAVGIILAVWLYSRRTKGLNPLAVFDTIVPGIALASFFIRMGNLMNSEIVGQPTSVPWSFVFTRVDGVPRHPTQVYEGLFYVFVSILLSRLYLSKKRRDDGFIFGAFLVLVFSSRFLLEFLKENQSRFESSLPLNMGQILSILLIWLGLRLLHKKRKITQIPAHAQAGPEVKNPARNPNRKDHG